MGTYNLHHYKTIYTEMQLKETDKLLEIWFEHNHLEWTDEAFLVVHDILIERLGVIPEVNPVVNQSEPQENEKKHCWNKRKIISILIILVPGIPLYILLFLAPTITIKPKDEWFTILILGFSALFCLVPGIFLGWEVIFNKEQVKEEIAEKLPLMRKRMGIFFRLFTYFLPDRWIPNYFFFGRIFTSVCLIGGGLTSIIALIIDVF